MPSRCFSLADDPIDFSAPHPLTGKPRTPGFPPGTLSDAQGNPIPGWCRISPIYRDLPTDASAAMRAKAAEVLSHLCYRHELEVWVVEGERYAFRVEHLYDEPRDRWYHGIGVYRRVVPTAPDPVSGATWSTPGARQQLVPPSIPRAELAAYARRNNIPCVTRGVADHSRYRMLLAAAGALALGAAAYWFYRPLRLSASSR